MFLHRLLEQVFYLLKRSKPRIGELAGIKLRIGSHDFEILFLDAELCKACRDIDGYRKSLDRVDSYLTGCDCGKSINLFAHCDGDVLNALVGMRTSVIVFLPFRIYNIAIGKE